MSTLQIRVTLTTAYQKESDLIKASAIAQSIAEPRTSFKRIRRIYPDSGAAGTIYGTRNPNLTGYSLKLDAPDLEDSRTSANGMYTEYTTDMYLKSTTNGDLLLIELTE